MSSNSRRLSSMVIDPFKQVKYGLYFIAISLVSFAIIGYAFWRSSLRQYEQLNEIFNVIGNDQWNVMLNDVFVENLIVMGAVFFVLSIVTIVSSFWMTHKIFGPQVAIQRFAAQIANENFSARVALRKADELQKLANSLNQMAERLEENAIEATDNDDSIHFDKAS